MVHVDLARSKALSKHEVVERWVQLFRAPSLVQRWLDGTALDAERKMAEHIIENWRLRLSDVSWFMH